MSLVNDLAMMINHCRINGTAGLSSDAARLGELMVILEDALNEFADIDQRFNWNDLLCEPRKNIWLNMIDVVEDIKETCSKYNSTLGVVNAAMTMQRIDPGDTVSVP